jgi:uridine phosphorylase
VSDSSGRDWQEQFRDIAKGWFFSDWEDRPFPSVVILPCENPDLHDHDFFVSRLADVQHLRAISVGGYREREIGILRSKLGAPAVALAVEVLARMGVTDILGVGFCGGLWKEISCGDLLLPLAAVRDDGTSIRYVTPEYPAVPAVEHLDLLRQIAKKGTARWHCGLVWSTDAALLETTEKVQHWSGRGVLGVDMETGALLTVSRLRGVRASSILVTSDHAGLGLETEIPRLKGGLQAALDLALECAAELASAQPARDGGR